MRLPRRGALALPLLLSPNAAARAAVTPPPFPAWVGRTALLSGSGWSARLLLTDDRTGLLSFRLLFLCRQVVVRSWQIAPDGRALSYERLSVRDPNRVIGGEARIEGDGLVLIERERREAEFEGFGPPMRTNACA